MGFTSASDLFVTKITLHLCLIMAEESWRPGFQVKLPGNASQMRRPDFKSCLSAVGELITFSETQPHPLLSETHDISFSFVSTHLSDGIAASLSILPNSNNYSISLHRLLSTYYVPGTILTSFSSFKPHTTLGNRHCPHSADKLRQREMQ